MNDAGGITLLEVANRCASALHLHEVIATAINTQKRVNRKTQIDIAIEVGYDKPNMITMWKNGTATMPLEKIPAAAKALELDPAFLTRLAMAQYWPNAAAVISQVFGTVLTANERALIDQIRKTVRDEDVPKLTRATELQGGPSG